MLPNDPLEPRVPSAVEALADQEPPVDPDADTEDFDPDTMVTRIQEMSRTERWKSYGMLTRMIFFRVFFMVAGAHFVQDLTMFRERPWYLFPIAWLGFYNLWHLWKLPRSMAAWLSPDEDPTTDHFTYALTFRMVMVDGVVYLHPAFRVGRVTLGITLVV